METLKLTPIDQIEDLADGVPVLAVEGMVKYAQELKRSQPDAAHPWTKQFFVLTSGTAEIACSMWDAEGSELSKGEKVHIENTQNKKGQWNGIVKGSYIKTEDEKPVRKHTLEIRANQVKITQANGMVACSSGEPSQDLDCDKPERLMTFTEIMDEKPKQNGGVTEARKHLMQSANLLNLCVDAVNNAIAPHVPAIAQTEDFFQAQVATLFIEASRSGYVSKMPTHPIKK